MINMLSPQDALIATMIVVSAADRDMSDKELKEIGAIVEILPVFDGYDRDKIGGVAQAVVDLLQEDSGLETLLGMIKDAAPVALHETVYAIACDVAAADGEIQIEEVRLLEMVRHTLGIERLAAAAIERGSRARHMRLT